MSKHSRTENSSVDQIAEQVYRLRALKGYPRDSEKAVDMHGKPIPGDAELIRVARKYAPSPDDLRKVVDRVLEEWEKCPAPAELRRCIQEMCAPAVDDRDNKLRLWRKEFREEIRKAIHALEGSPNGRQIQDAREYLQYANSQHPDVFQEEYRRMAPREEVRAIIEPLLTCGPQIGPVALLMGKGSAEDYARLRRTEIRHALESVTEPAKGGTPESIASRQFWPEHLAWAEREHSEEVDAIREGR